MTMPTLIQNHQKRSLEVATQKFYSMMSQAVKQYMADEGVDDLRNTPLASDNYEDTDSHEAIASIRNFVTKYLKVAKECDYDANNCFVPVYKDFNGQVIEGYNFTDNVGGYDYVLADGSIIRIGYYGPIELYVDINGKKGPNRVGYDLWSMSIFYDGSIDEGTVTPECKKGIKPPYNGGLCSGVGNTPSEVRNKKYEHYCREEGWYGGCFGHFLENNFKFDY